MASTQRDKMFQAIIKLEHPMLQASLVFKHPGYYYCKIKDFYLSVFLLFLHLYQEHLNYLIHNFKYWIHLSLETVSLPSPKICFTEKSPARGSLYISPLYALYIRNNQIIIASGVMRRDIIVSIIGTMEIIIDNIYNARKVTSDCIA